jgi:arylformamidase
MVHSGYAVANLNCGLCPDVTLELSRAKSATPCCFRSAKPDSFGFDPARIHVAGHSAGGHLAASASAR